MKTVSGKVVSTKPVKLSKAANILSNFVTSDNGASQAVSTYLRRASAAFNELVYFKKHYKMKKSQLKEETSTRSDMRTGNIEDVRVLEKVGVNRKIYQNPDEVNEQGTKTVEGSLRKKEKKKKIDDSLGSGKNEKIEVGNETVKEKSEDKKKKKKIDDSSGSGKNDNIEVGNETVKEKSEDKKKKKRKTVEVDVGEISNSMSPERKKKRRIEAAQ